MQRKKELLQKIIKLTSPKDLNLLAQLLREAGWDSPEGELVSLTREDIVSILQKYLSDELSAQQVEDWANLVERREDITYGLYNDEDRIMDAINELANPVLEGPLTHDSALALIEKLRTAQGAE